VTTPPQLAGLVDAHCHLDYPPMSDDVAAALARARAAGVDQVVHVGCSLDRIAPALALAETHAEVFAAVGIHPHDAVDTDDAVLARLRELWAHPRVVAIGETGLDYHYDRSPRDRQRESLAQHAELAREVDAPLVLHIRDAHEDAWEVLARHPARTSAPGMVHCFTGDAAQARRWLDLGYCLSFSGIATFRNAETIREAARLCPSDRILLETDAPFLAPEPMRGRRNEPALVGFTCARLAQERGQTGPELAEIAARNTRALLALPPPAA
jgi:TatD DNase family protein